MRFLYQQITKFFKTRPLFLLMLPLFFMYSGYNELFGFLSFQFVALNLFIILLVVLLVLLISKFLFKSWAKAAVYTFFIAQFCLAFGYIHDSLKELHLPPIFTKFTFILPLFVVLFFALYIYIKKREKGYTDLFLFLNLLFSILLLSEIPNSLKRYQLDKSVHNLIDFRFNTYNEYAPAPATSKADSAKPDIYFLVFDAMASSKSVFTTTGKSIADLDTFLSNKGFYLATNAKANYNWTIHSVSTTLNMDYLPPWIAPVMDDLKVYFWGSSSFKDNSLFRILQKENYSISSYQPISFGNNQWPNEPYFHNLKKYHYYFKTLPGRIYKDVFWNFTRINIGFVKKRQLELTHERDLIKKSGFDTTISLIKASCGKSNQPKFVYGHFMLPHDPYVFDSTGKLKSPEKTIVKNSKEDLEGYYQQLRFATKVIRDLVTYIQTNNKKNTVIIVAGDHGFKTEDARVKGYTFNNYSAFYFPDGQYQTLYDSASPVNTFRLVLNKYFHAGLPILKDSSTLVVPEQKETMRVEQFNQNKKQK